MKDLSPGGLRVDFTFEREAEVTEVLQRLEDLCHGIDTTEISFTDITRGHFNRGVE